MKNFIFPQLLFLAIKNLIQQEAFKRLNSLVTNETRKVFNSNF